MAALDISGMIMQRSHRWPVQQRGEVGLPLRQHHLARLIPEIQCLVEWIVSLEIDTDDEESSEAMSDDGSTPAPSRPEPDREHDDADQHGCSAPETIRGA